MEEQQAVSAMRGMLDAAKKLTADMEDARIRGFPLRRRWRGLRSEANCSRRARIETGCWRGLPSVANLTRAAASQS